VSSFHQSLPDLHDLDVAELLLPRNEVKFSVSVCVVVLIRKSIIIMSLMLPLITFPEIPERFNAFR
jgi:hypothetical protein